MFVLVGGLLLGTGCGGLSAAQRAQERTSFVEADTFAKQSRARVERDLQRAADAETCDTQLRDLVDSLGDLNSRLAVGLSFQDYSEHLGDVRVAYDKVDFSSLPATCLRRVGVPAENALNNYITAYNTWNNCIDDEYCDVDTIDFDLQTEWTPATTRVERASSRLDAMTAASISTTTDPEAEYVHEFAIQFCAPEPLTHAGKKLCSYFEKIRAADSVSADEAKASERLIRETQRKIAR
jgi:hypothetical protein